MKLVDHAWPAPCPHRAAELVGLSRRETRRHDRQPHRLLLEERHAERLFEHAANRVVRIRDRLLAISSPKIRMDHVTLDRPRPHDRHLDHEVVEAGRPQPRQHAHLGAALDLEDADRIGP